MANHFLPGTEVIRTTVLSDLREDGGTDLDTDLDIVISQISMVCTMVGLTLIHVLLMVLTGATGVVTSTPSNLPK